VDGATVGRGATLYNGQCTGALWRSTCAQMPPLIRVSWSAFAMTARLVKGIVTSTLTQ
jgi:hypothetical protein